jgi:hypothetical protein
MVKSRGRLKRSFAITQPQSHPQPPSSTVAGVFSEISSPVVKPSFADVILTPTLPNMTQYQARYLSSTPQWGQWRG